VFNYARHAFQEDCNVICVDWEAGALIPNYVRAAANTRLVGKQLSMLLEGLNKHLGLPFHNIHVIGFSLGAHAAGFAGAELKNLSRITGKYEATFQVTTSVLLKM
jgi:triacylglycerol lipase